MHKKKKYKKKIQKIQLGKQSKIEENVDISDMILDLMCFLFFFNVKSLTYFAIRAK